MKNTLKKYLSLSLACALLISMIGCGTASAPAETVPATESVTEQAVEHKHFEFQTGEGTVITREYPATWKKGDEPYYPINDEKNGALYAQYAELAKKEANVLFGGRLGQYKYYDMDKVIRSALDMVKEELAR